MFEVSFLFYESQNKAQIIHVHGESLPTGKGPQPSKPIRGGRPSLTCWKGREASSSGKTELFVAATIVLSGRRRSNLVCCIVLVLCLLRFLELRLSSHISVTRISQTLTHFALRWKPYVTITYFSSLKCQCAWPSGL